MQMDSVGASSSNESMSSPRRRAQPEEALEFDDIELGGWGEELVLSFDIEEWAAAKTAPFVRNADKYFFTFGVLNLITLVYFSAHHQYVLMYYYTAKAPVLIALRYFSYKKSSWHWFLLDFCYAANALLLVSMWAYRDEPRVFMVAFAVINGPLASAVVLFHNSLVFHSIDKTTSVFIHVSPVLLSYVARWHLNDREYSGRFEYTVCLNDDCSIDWLYSYAYAVAFFAIHQVIYFFLVHFVWRKSIEENPKALTTYRYLMRNKRSPMYKAAMMCGPGASRVMFSVWYVVFSAIIMLPSLLMYEYEGVHMAVLILVVITVVWNGSTWYMDVFRSSGRRGSLRAKPKVKPSKE